MGTFDFWVKWGEKLSHKQFANAFTALGILFSKPSRKVRLISDDQLLREDTDYKKLIKDELVHALSERLRLSLKGLVINWRYPMPGHYLLTDQLCIPLAKLDPLLVSEAWSEVERNLKYPLRLRVLTFPKMELIKPWFQLLLESDPGTFVNSVYINYKFKEATIELKWPLRLGFLPENDLDIVIDNVINNWQWGNIVNPVKIGRENANCDVLVFNGNSDQLLEALNKLPVPMKCNLFILRGELSNQLKTMDKQLSHIAEKCHAGGFIFIHPETSDENLQNGLNRLIDTLCHDKTMDIAVFDSFKIPHDFARLSRSKVITGFKYPYKSLSKFDPLIILDKRLADYHLHKLVIKMQKRIQFMPRTTKFLIPHETIRRIDKTLPQFGPPVDNIKDLNLMLLDRSEFESVISEGVFDHAYEGAEALAEINVAIDQAIEPEEVQKKSHGRYIQAQTFVLRADKYKKENRAFLIGIKSRIRIRIGPKGKEWMSSSTVFPEVKLPKDVESWRLIVVLSEPNHLTKPLQGEIKLPKFGSSSECDFDFISSDNPLFDGRVTVLHRGRILQTAVLRFDVVSDLKNLQKKPQRRLITESIHVRAHIGDLDQRRQFDLAFVTNHNSDTRPRLTAVSKNHAWFTELSGCIPIATEINEVLTQVARSVNDYRGKINTKNNTEILVKLAQCGARLRNIITEELDAPNNKPHFAELQYLQIVTTQNDKVIPFEFIYDQEAPEDDAKFCSSGLKALSDIMKLGNVNKVPCFNGCTVELKKFVCPIAFWGIQKVIERHRYVPGLGKKNRSYYLQSSEVTRNRETLMMTGNVLVAASKRVKLTDLNSVINICTQKFGLAHKANDWKQWVEIVNREKPRILLAMPHTEGENTSATLEIGGDTKKSNLMEYGYVRPKDANYYPLVALLGCDTAGTAENFGSHVVNFRQYKAAVVIGTIASVFGEHAAIVTKRLVEGLSKGTAESERIGEVIRSIKQQSLLEGMIMPLCVVAFGDADWKLK